MKPRSPHPPISAMPREVSMKRNVPACLCAVAALASLATPARADFASCLASLRGPAAAKGVSGATFERLTAGLEPNPDIIKAEGYQPEFRTAIWDYLAGLVDEERVQDGEAGMAQYRQYLAQDQSPLRRAALRRGRGLGRRVELRQELRLEAGDPVAGDAVLRARQPPSGVLPRRAVRGDEDRAVRRHRSRRLHRLLGRRLRPHPVHALDLPRHGGRRRRRRPPRPRPFRARRARLHRQLPAQGRLAAGSWAGASRSSCPKAIADPPGARPSSRCRPGRRAASPASTAAAWARAAPACCCRPVPTGRPSW